MLVNLINSYLDGTGNKVYADIIHDMGDQAQSIFIRQFGERKERDAGLYLSAIGKCQRQLAYNLLGFEQAGKEIDARAKMVFTMGDLTELVITGLIRQVGVTLTDQQKEVAINGILGHIDGIVAVGGKKYLLEVKSMSSYSFDKFDKGEIDPSYIYQVNAYMYALGLDECIFIGLNKDSGVLGEMVITKSGLLCENIEARIKKVTSATKETLPEQDFKPDEKGILPWNCLYCAYWQTCRPKAEKVLMGKSYKLKEKI